ncbi:MAG: flagellar biosynthetic protein FliR [Oligoflexia bacterium]|nr:flagellar biosynthetic protein FliR [Oligoflexia bacterium]
MIEFEQSQPLVALLERTLHSPYICGVSLLLMRCFGALLYLPFEGWLVGALNRLVIAAVMAFSIYNPSDAQPQISGLRMLEELIIGSVAGMPLFLVMEVFGMCGALFDLMRGQSIAGSYAPQVSEAGSSMEALTRRLILSCLCMSGALENLIGSLQRSQQIFPLGVLPESFFSTALIGQCSTLLSNGLVWFLPVVLLFLSLEIALGIGTRFLPGLTFNAEGLLIKTVVGTLALLSLWAAGSKAGIAQLAQISWISG